MFPVRLDRVAGLPRRALKVIYRCGCCLLSGTAKYKVAWCKWHDMYECARCWEHAHPHATQYTWGCEDDEDPKTDPYGELTTK